MTMAIILAVFAVLSITCVQEARAQVFDPWTEWTDAGSCSTTCGTGNQVQFRLQVCTADCRTEFVITETRVVTCQICACPTISQWTQWADDGPCSTTCGDGTKMQSRTRMCSGSTCCPDFALVETRPMTCQICTCPTITQWTQWADDEPCSTTCGDGTKRQSRTRMCSGSTCCQDVTLVETRPMMCRICTCPTISQWTQWADDEPCSTTCGDGTKMQSRTRSCTDSTCCPADFTTTETRTMMCQICTCPTISQWTQWADDEPCSTTCGDGTKMQSRTRMCSGSTCCQDVTLAETRPMMCQICTCPTISQWTQWADDEPCSTTCGDGTKMQSRTRMCSGSTCCQDVTLAETRPMMCQICTCPTISEWTQWADDEPCSTTCGDGTKMQSRTRSCTDSTCCPADFTTTETRTMMCQICTCPNISGWTEWADDGTCSTTCGDGTKMQSRTRSCTDSTCCPPDFTTTETRTMMCQICTCPVIGPWCPWANTGPCSVTCGSGTQMQARHRLCINTCTPPDCPTRVERAVNCSPQPCHPSSWNSWSATGSSNWTQWPRWNGGSKWSRSSRRRRWSRRNRGYRRG